MGFALYLLVTISVFAVLAVLAIGLYMMMHNKGANLSQKLMRWRVGLQFVAILAIIGYIFMAN